MSSGTLKELRLHWSLSCGTRRRPTWAILRYFRLCDRTGPATELQMESIGVPHGDPPSPLLTVIMTASPLGEGGRCFPMSARRGTGRECGIGRLDQPAQRTRDRDVR